MFWAIASSIVGVIMATAMIIIRARASKQPASIRKIVLPPLFMSTGALMFLFPMFRVDWSQVLEAIVVGMVFSIFLIKTTKFEIQNESIYLIPSRLFIVVLVGLLLLRLILKSIIGQSISVGETSGMFFLLAFGMILTWRFFMLIKFKKLQKQIIKNP
ncbi:cytochrome c biogenesis protein CcdC [Aquibacillus koreensis]|uniref:Cytochrome c biogenesis protein CcdC n=1 Tax=Aquibacillus koreensis TaxID=279446 RepID=A0A9X4AKA6_9BACI|nr:cytochrome c biogenesis protein CcdC [Aquibacillus koreensis]MCT2536394.1 cytochrome c biogenesis protein CcdC [Aquibacillus koreensis]MDC3421255.1 cytochrome c biogenesis protein CcdC [Aquibacillus koreensis]